jgi:RNA polymerase-binding transcription factor DksA
MSTAELARYRGALLALRGRLAGDVSSLADEARNSEDEASGNLSHVPIHMADLGTYEREFTLGLLANEEHTLEEIAAALGRIERGTFGHCEGCRTAIRKDRLDALPYARYCVECARRLPA